MTFIQKGGLIQPAWILIDMCSTHSVSNNKKLAKNIVLCTPNKVLTIWTNGGKKIFKMKSELKLFLISLHYNEDSLAMILSLKDVASIKGVSLTNDTAVE